MSDRQRPGSSQIYFRHCIFCQKESKYIKGNKTRDYVLATYCIMQRRELRTDATIRMQQKKKKKKKKKKAEESLPLLAESLLQLKVAIIHMYVHRSCYRNYTKSLNTTVNVSTKEDTDHYAVALEKSYTELLHFIRTDLFANCQL